MRPDAPFLASSSARPAAAFRDLPEGNEGEVVRPTARRPLRVDKLEARVRALVLLRLPQQLQESDEADLLRVIIPLEN